MRIGSPPVRGFTYLWLLFAVAIAGASLAVAGESSVLRARREREAESIFRAQQVADALASWQRATRALGTGDPGAAPAWEELLEDRRGPVLVRHLRRLYDDPMTGRPDWQWARDAHGAIVGVRSRSDAAALITHDLPDGDGGPPRFSDRIVRPASPASAAASSAA